jgi:hypothetical protein
MPIRFRGDVIMKAFLSEAIYLGIAFAIMCVVSMALAWPFMWAWNYSVVGALSVARDIDYWRAFALLWFLLSVRGVCSGTPTHRDRCE